MPDSIQKRLRLLKAEIIAQGGRQIEIIGGRHIKIRFVNPKGEPRMLVVASSPSDFRAERQIVREIRRLMEFTCSA
jgi:hypothetical protein